MCPIKIQQNMVNIARSSLRSEDNKPQAKMYLAEILSRIICLELALAETTKMWINTAVKTPSAEKLNDFPEAVRTIVTGPTSVKADRFTKLIASTTNVDENNDTNDHLP